MSDDLEPAEAVTNWRHIIVVSSLIFALMVVTGAIVMHLKEKPQIVEPDYKELLSLSAASDPDVSASTSKEEDEWEYNNSNYKDSDYKYADYDEDFAEDFTGSTTDTIRLANVVANSESDSESAEALEAGTDFRTSSQKLKLLQRELKRCYAANNKSVGLTEANSHTQPPPPLLTELCLQCICETATECRSVECGTGVACGIFRISYNYWIDAGRPRLQGVDESKNLTERDVHTQCVNNPLCATRAVAAYLKKYARDCNQDGKIDCLDHAELHVLGPNGCLRDEMPPIFAMRLEKCLAKFN